MYCFFLNKSTGKRSKENIVANQVSPMRCGEREVMVFPGFKAGSIQLVSDDDDDDDAV